MELDALKTIWLKTDEIELPVERLTREEISYAMEQKSDTVISKIRNRLKLKIWMQSMIGVLGIALALFLLKKDEAAFGISYTIVFGMILALAIHKLRHYKLILDFQKTSPTLRETMVHIIDIMNKVIRAQILTSVLLATVFAILFSYLGLQKLEGISLWIQTLTVIAIALLTPGIFYLIAKRGQQKMFGKYLQMLRDYVSELDEEKE